MSVSPGDPGGIRIRGRVLKPTRPALRYLGGKWRMARRIIPVLPPHRIYVEPFGGAASVLLQKPRSYAEIYNDLDDEVVNLFRVLRDPEQSANLARLIELTPFARAEFDGAYEPADDPVERARRLVVRSFMGHGNVSYRLDRTTGFRRNATRSGTTPAHDWVNLPGPLAATARRLLGVVIEKRPASEVIAQFDGADTLFYVDPPYVHGTRSEKRTRLAPSTGYVHEMDDAAHGVLLDQLCGLAGMVVLSGYAHPIYDSHAGLRRWRRIEMETHADGGRPRTEILCSPAADHAGGLFGAPENAA